MFFFFLMFSQLLLFTRTYTLFPSTPLFRYHQHVRICGRTGLDGQGRLLVVDVRHGSASIAPSGRGPRRRQIHVSPGDGPGRGLTCTSPRPSSTTPARPTTLRTSLAPHWRYPSCMPRAILACLPTERSPNTMTTH